MKIVHPFVDSESNESDEEGSSVVDSESEDEDAATSFAERLRNNDRTIKEVNFSPNMFKEDYEMLVEWALACKFCPDG